MKFRNLKSVGIATIDVLRDVKPPSYHRLFVLSKLYIHLIRKRFTFSLGFVLRTVKLIRQCENLVAWNVIIAFVPFVCTNADNKNHYYIYYVECYL